MTKAKTTAGSARIVRAMLGAAGLCLSAGASAQAYSSTIHFQWSGGAPDRLAHNDPVIGDQIVNPVQNPQTWQGSHQVTMPQTRLYLHYGNDGYLLPFRSYRQAEPVTLAISRPSFTCTTTSIDQIEASLGQDSARQLVAMMAAGVLLTKPAVQCPLSSRRRLSDLYYRLNCQLAGSTLYVGYLREAEDHFRTRWTGNAESLAFIAQCRTNAQAMLRNAMAGRLQQFASSQQFDAAIALASDIQTMRSDPAWAPAFENYALSDTDINAWQISRMIAAQVQAQATNNLLGAQGINAQLLQRAQDPSQQGAFDQAQVPLTRITNDAATIAASIAAQRRE